MHTLFVERISRSLATSCMVLDMVVMFAILLPSERS